MTSTDIVLEISDLDSKIADIVANAIDNNAKLEFYRLHLALLCTQREYLKREYEAMNVTKRSK